MLNTIVDLVTKNGMGSVTITVKPHGDSVAATINLVPNSTAIPDVNMQAALAMPIVLIGTDNLSDLSVENVLSQVRNSLNGNDYLTPHAISERIGSAEPKNKQTNSTTTAKPPATAPASADDLFSDETL